MGDLNLTDVKMQWIHMQPALEIGNKLAVVLPLDSARSTVRQILNLSAAGMALVAAGH